jgi:predicted nucleotidyltransferase
LWAVPSARFQRESELLTASGLVHREVRGKQVYFQANQKAAIFPELQGLFAKTAGLVDILREALIPLANRVNAAFVFGSAARGDLHASSDIDLLVVGETSFGRCHHGDTTSGENDLGGMSIRARNTKCELLLCAALRRLGLEFRRNVRSLPGKPDIVFSTGPARDLL